MKKEIPINKLVWISTKVAFFMLFCLSCSVMGQEGKKTLYEKDYVQWETLLPTKISSDGGWVTYGIRTSNLPYTMIVQSTKSDTKFEMEGCYNNNFSNNGKWLFALDFNSRLTKIELNVTKKTEVDSIVSYQYSIDSENLAYLQKITSSDTKNLIVENLLTKKFLKFDNVIEYQFSPNGKYLAVVQHKKGVQTLLLYDLRRNRIHNEYSILNAITFILWQPNSKGLAFFETKEEDNNEVHWWQNINDDKTLRSFETINKGLIVSTSNMLPNLFSEDSKTLLFQASTSEIRPFSVDTAATQSSVQVWNTKDEFLYPAYKTIHENFGFLSMTVAWSSKNNEWHFLGNKEATSGIFGDGKNYSYAYSYKDMIMASDDMEASSFIYVFDIASGISTPVIKKKTGLEFKISHTGRYLSYFQDYDWFVYDAKLNLHTNLTKDITTSFANPLSNSPPNSAYGNPGWTSNDKEIILYDKYDIWVISPDNKTKYRLTTGKERENQYRLYTLFDDFIESSNFGYIHDTPVFNFKNGVVLSAHDLDQGKTGYFTYSIEDGLKTIIFKDALISNLRLSHDGSTLIYSEETYNSPPKLMLKTMDKDNSKILYQSNPQHFDYSWGHSQLIDYTTQDGKHLKGILYYPSDFDPNKKYPTIVSCYEIQTNGLHNYYNPTLDNSIGFSISNFTTQGYFVFLPDIVYNIGDPGLSALNCVTAGVEKITQLPFINKDKIGLHGHSFGGYESMFLVTHTDIFAAAIAGAGASNMLSFYLSMAWIWNMPQYKRFEDHQWRMGDTYYNIPEAYNRNSPILYVPNITTPILGWAGKEDSNVNWEQHMEFFLAMRTMKKEHILLLYEEEGHDLSKPENRIDLTNKQMDWYDFYLKDSPAADWMTDIH